MDYDFDLITIGAGSGGVAASRRAAAASARRWRSSRRPRRRHLRDPRLRAEEAVDVRGAVSATCWREARGYGWRRAQRRMPRFEMARWAAAKAAEIARLEEVYRQMLAAASVELIEGRARIDGAAHGARRRARASRRGTC